MHRVLPILLIGLAFALAGCYGSPVVVATKEPRCPGGAASPLTTGQVLEALESEGIDAFAEERSASCVDENVVASLANTSLEDPDPPTGEGSVYCAIRRTRVYRGGLEEETDRGLLSMGGETDFWLANVDCSVYPDGDDQDAQIARLRRAMEALEASL